MIRDIDPIDTYLGCAQARVCKRTDPFGRGKQSVGHNPEASDSDLMTMLHQVFEVVPKKRFSPGEADVTHPRSSQRADQLPQCLGIGARMCAACPRTRVAVRTSQVALASDFDSEQKGGHGARLGGYVLGLGRSASTHEPDHADHVRIEFSTMRYQSSLAEGGGGEALASCGTMTA